jgi:hypothetical protein
VTASYDAGHEVPSGARQVCPHKVVYIQFTVGVIREEEALLTVF